ncbi:hypothetical protein VQL36_08815 [Chengkuizengella sp. SCS-71B]|uniref:hypothetical protein n=1 Tax=Chengkuizengella sp. SCS-71B TaxID=3115290 RepID=UPI0032C233A9
MGLKKGSFVVADTVSVDDPYDISDPNVIELTALDPSADVLTIDVCVKSKNTKVCIDSMAQIAILDISSNFVTFEITYEILRNDTVIATINDEMDYESVVQGRHTNFPNFPIVDDTPDLGVNRYVLRCTDELCLSRVTVGSRSLKATVFEC